MKSDYWNVSDEQVIENTGKPLAHWEEVLGRFAGGDPTGKKSGDLVAHLQKDHGVPRYWARTLTTRFLKGLAGGREKPIKAVKAAGSVKPKKGGRATGSRKR